MKKRPLTELAKQRVARGGQTLVEYALILAFIAILAIGILTTLGQQTRTLFCGISSQIARSNGS